VTVDREWRNGLDEALAEKPRRGGGHGLVLPRELRTPAQVVFEQRGGFRRGVRKLRYCGPRLPGNELYPLGAGMFGAGCNMVLQRRLVLDLGGFDEALDTARRCPAAAISTSSTASSRPAPRWSTSRAMLVFHRHRAELEALQRQYGARGVRASWPTSRRPAPLRAPTGEGAGDGAVVARLRRAQRRRHGRRAAGGVPSPRARRARRRRVRDAGRVRAIPSGARRPSGADMG
jgi:hypothetical protein